MKKKRFLAAVLCAVMVLALLPTTAFAAGEAAIQLGTGGVKANDKVYFGKYGTYDVPWYVLNAGSGSAFLLSEYLLGDSGFQASGNGYYKGSTLNAKMDEFYNAGMNTLFTTTERGAIVAKTNLSCVDGPNDNAASPAVPTAYLYPLSYNEADAQGGWGSSILQAKYITAPTGSAGWWWLRSSIDDINAYCVVVGGYDSYHHVFADGGVRPAFNLDLFSVLFTSAAVGGKISGAEGAGALNQNLTPSGRADWKLTLLDNAAGSGRESFDVSTTSVSATTAGGSVDIAYSGANVQTATTAPEYLSAMLVSGTSVLYYGRLKNIASPADASGTQSITIPSGLAAGSYTLKIFNEQYNGDYKTDYASAMKDVTLTVTAPTASIGDATVSGTTGTAITPVDATITLTNEQFNALAANADVSGWFTNRPAGLAAKIKTAVAANATTATITFSGTPTAASAAAMTVTIPAASLVGNTALTVTANANAKWAITAPPPPGPVAPVITDPAADEPVRAVEGQPVTLSVTATNATGYQWWVNRGSGFVKISGATSASYTTAPVTQANNGYQYYCVVTGTGGSVTSPIFTLNVTAVPATGDSFTPGLWLGLMLLLGAGLAVSAMQRRRKRG